MNWDTFITQIKDGMLPERGMTAASKQAVDEFCEAEIKRCTELAKVVPPDLPDEEMLAKFRDGVQERFHDCVLSKGFEFPLPDTSTKLTEMFSMVTLAHMKLTIEDPKTDAARQYTALVMQHCINTLASLVCVASECDLTRTGDAASAVLSSVDSKIRTKLAGHLGQAIQSSREGGVSSEIKTMAEELEKLTGKKVRVVTLEDLAQSEVLDKAGLRETVETEDEDCDNPDCPVHGFNAGRDALLAASLKNEAVRRLRHFGLNQVPGSGHAMGEVLANSLGRMIATVGGPTQEGQDKMIDHFISAVLRARTDMYIATKGVVNNLVEREQDVPAPHKFH